MSNEAKVEVEDVASYIKYIKSLSPTINGDARTYESTFVFRGQGSTKFDLVPSIGRGSYRREPGSNTISPITGSLTHEADIIETACRILPNVFKRDLLPIDLLACLPALRSPYQAIRCNFKRTCRPLFRLRQS